jgi:hypothetical protein
MAPDIEEKIAPIRVYFTADGDRGRAAGGALRYWAP